MRLITRIAAGALTVSVATALAGCGGSTAGSDDASVVANAAGAPTPGTSGPPTTTAPTGEVVAVQPADQGAAVLSAIGSATSSVDVVIYQIGGNEIGQALLNAMKRGVKVRLMMDGYSASQVKYNGQFATSMQQAVAAAGLPAGALTSHWSSDNFNITHQKSVMIDAVDGNGAPLPAGSLPPTARLLVSTGNFQDFGSTPFYAARDFYLTTDDQNLINQASTVFASDFSCAGSTETNNLKSSTDLVWSNGTTGLYAGQVGQYPPVTIGYFGPNKVSNPAPVVQGNSFDYQLALITGAKPGDVVRIYNEEFTSGEFVKAVTAAAQAGVDVRIVMSYEQPSSKGPSQSMVNLTNMSGAVPADSALPGVSVTLVAPQQVVPQALYVHAKSILVTDSGGNFRAGFVGSENLSNPSMDDNRELGLPLTPSSGAVASTIQQTFDADYNSADNTTRLDKTNPSNIPAAWNGSGAADGAGLAQAPGAADGTPDAQLRLGSPAGKCGPVATS